MLEEEKSIIDLREMRASWRKTGGEERGEMEMFRDSAEADPEGASCFTNENGTCVCCRVSAGNIGT